MNQSWITVQVVAKSSEAVDIASFDLASADGTSLPPFTAGAHIDVEVAPGLIRQYSLCDHSIERNCYQIAVLRCPDSRGGSVGMAEHVRPGSTLRISEPKNHFPLQPADRSILLAGGIGVTPLLCMAERLAHAESDFEMHYCARSRERMAFYDRLSTSAFSERVHFHFDDGDAAQRLNIAASIGKPHSSVHLYVCGPAGMINAVLRTASDLQWQPTNVHREFFVSSVGTIEGKDAFSVKIASSGQVFEVPADKPVTDILRDAGIEIPVSCEQGVCGTCLTRVLQGRPDHRDVFLTADEQARNDQFTPCCSRSKTPLLVLDL